MGCGLESRCVGRVYGADGGQQVCPKHVELFTKIKLRNRASRWLLLQDWFDNVKLILTTSVIE